jgi:hypothetical protein
MLWLRHCERITDGLRLTAIHSLTFVCGRYQHHALCAMWLLDGLQLTSASLRAFSVLSVSLSHSHSSKPNPISLFYFLRAYPLSYTIIPWLYDDDLPIIGRWSLKRSVEATSFSSAKLGGVWQSSSHALRLSGLVLLSHVTPPWCCLRKQDCSTWNRFQR